MRTKSPDRQYVPNFCGDSFRTLVCNHFLVGHPTLFRFLIIRLAVRPVINERANRNPGKELWSTANMVSVIVSEQNKINFRDPRFLGGGDNSVRVTPGISGPAGIDQQRLAFRSDEESCLPALDVYKVDLQGLA